MPTCLVIQHVAPEPAFTITDALVSAGVEVKVRQVFSGDHLPDDLSAIDGLVVMGGPMSASSDAGFATRQIELSLIRQALNIRLPLLGVCLGAQLLATAAGAKVQRGAQGPEIGWGPVVLLPARQHDRLFSGLPDQLTVLHWHGDTFDLPQGAEHLASNAVYPNQAFRFGAVAWGVQFHLEVTDAAVEGFLRHFAADANHAPGGADALRSMTPGAIAALAGSRALVLDRFAQLVAEGASNR